MTTPSLGRKQVKVAAALGAANRRHRLPMPLLAQTTPLWQFGSNPSQNATTSIFRMLSVYSNVSIQKHLSSQGSPHPPAFKTLAFNEQDQATDFRATPLQVTAEVAIWAHPCRDR